jgi:hypothetical protein
MGIGGGQENHHFHPMSVSCASTSFCVAVTDYTSSAGYTQNLVLTYNGSEWSQNSSASLSTSATQNNQLDGVSCTSPSFCAAVGYYMNPAGYDQNLALVYNGSTWSLNSSASLSVSAGSSDQLYNISCASENLCVAAGNYIDAPGDIKYVLGGAKEGFVVTWNGTSWSVDNSPSLTPRVPGSVYRFNGISCVSTGFCALAGAANTGAGQSDLVLSYMAPAPAPGYWLVSSGGGVFSFGGAQFHGSLGAVRLTAPVVGMAVTEDAKGYWLAASDGGVFSFGDARFYGSAARVALRAPIVGIASTPDGKGYWLVARDGGIFGFGDAQFYGSAGYYGTVHKHLAAPIVGIEPTLSGNGYWLVASDGGIFSFGDAKFYGSLGAKRLNAPIVGIAPTRDGKGYWLVASDGGIFSFGDARFYGSLGGRRLNAPVVGIASTVAERPGAYPNAATTGMSPVLQSQWPSGSIGPYGQMAPSTCLMSHLRTRPRIPPRCGLYRRAPSSFKGHCPPDAFAHLPRLLPDVAFAPCRVGRRSLAP